MSKYFKRISALLIAVVMVMAMCTTAFAAEATVTIQNAGNGRFWYGQIIKPDTSKETGWAFADSEIETAFKTAFDAVSDQAVIKALIDAEEKGSAVSSTQLANALNAVLTTKATTPVTGNSFKVTSAGVYVIKGTEENYVYSPMAAYVSFKSYDTTTGLPTELENKTVEAKKAPTSITKTSDQTDKITEIGRDVTYTVTSTVPYLPLSDSERYYEIKDTITGADYKVETEGENAGKLAVTVKIGSSVEETLYVNVTGNSFTVDLLKYLENNTYANQTLEISYKATVTDVHVGNSVQAGNGKNDGSSKYGSSSTDLYTGEITLTKLGENRELLKGAEFVVYKTVNDEKNYAIFENNKFKSWTTEEKDATHVTTGEDGTVKVEGLDADATGIEYFFKEVKAPEGYSINTTDVSTSLKLEGQTVATEVIKAKVEMSDTKLSALPSTGGIGTTIFTVVGCLIMIAAAAMFFMSRRKAEK